MRRLIAFGGFVFVVFSANTALSACGEKFFFYGRVVTQQQILAARVPGLVAMYTNPASKLPAVLQQTKLDEHLKAAGHKVDSITNAEALSRALKSGRYDVLLVDAADADQWKASGVVVVPVLYKPTKMEDRAAGKNYASVLKADKTNEAILMVNNLIKARPKTRPTP